MTSVSLHPLILIRRLSASIEEVYVKHTSISGVANGCLDELATWEAVLALAKAHAPGGARLTIKEYVQKNTTWLSRPWQRAAYDWALLHPSQTLVVKIRVGRKSQTWHIGRRGEYVLFLVPGCQERRQAWISRDRRTRVFIHLD